MTTLYLVRHAVHDLVGKVLAGRMPGVPLSQEGFGQAAGLRRHFATLPLSRILSSPVQRAVETAETLRGDHAGAVEIAPALTEIDCGEWTGQPFDRLAGDPRWQTWNSERAGATMPGGEGMRAVQARVGRLMDDLLEDRGPVVMVSHADVIKAAVALVIGMSLDLHDRLTIDPASITTIDMWGPGAGKIVRLNEMPLP